MLTKDQIENIPNLRKEGKSPAEIAELYNVNVSAVRRWIRKLVKVGHKIPEMKKGRPAINLTPKNNGEKEKVEKNN